MLLCEVDAGRAAPDLVSGGHRWVRMRSETRHACSYTQTPTSAGESEALLGRGPPQPYSSQRVRGSLVPAAAHLVPILASTSSARSGAGALLSLPATRTQPGAPAEQFSAPPPDAADDAALAAPRVFGGGLVPAALPSESPVPFDEFVLAGAGQARVRFVVQVRLRLRA